MTMVRTVFDPARADRGEAGEHGTRIKSKEAADLSCILFVPITADLITVGSRSLASQL